MESSIYIALKASSRQAGKTLPLIGTSTGTCGPSYSKQLHIPNMSKRGEQRAGLTPEVPGLAEKVEVGAGTTEFTGTKSIASGLSLNFKASTLNMGLGLGDRGGGRGGKQGGGPRIETTLKFKPVAGVGDTGDVP